jgi:hypothetical protein
MLDRADLMSMVDDLLHGMFERPGPVKPLSFLGDRRALADAEARALERIRARRQLTDAHLPGR